MSLESFLCDIGKQCRPRSDQIRVAIYRFNAQQYVKDELKHSMMYNLKQKLGIKWNAPKLVIYVTYNKTNNRLIIYTRFFFLEYRLTVFFINRMLILWCLNAYR